MRAALARPHCSPWLRVGKEDAPPARVGYNRGVMSAIEIIEQIKALPPAERQVIDQFVKASSTTEASSSEGQTSEFEELVDSVFDKHANLLHRLAQ
jgi:hypothetical protein